MLADCVGVPGGAGLIPSEERLPQPHHLLLQPAYPRLPNKETGRSPLLLATRSSPPAPPAPPHLLHLFLLATQFSLLAPHHSPLAPRSSLLAPRSSLLAPRSSLLTTRSSLLTPHYSLLAPHSSLLTTHLLHYSPLLATHNLLLAPRSSLLATSKRWRCWMRVSPTSADTATALSITCFARSVSEWSGSGDWDGLERRTADCVGNARLCGQCPIVWAMPDCVGNARLCGQCPIAWAMPDCVGNVRLCGQCPIVWAIPDRVGNTRSCGAEPHTTHHRVTQHAARSTQ